MTTPKKKDQEKTVPPLQLCMFDVRRGRVEGQEADCVLGFYPSGTDATDQASVVGLVQAMSAFSSIFDQVMRATPKVANGMTKVLTWIASIVTKEGRGTFPKEVGI